MFAETEKNESINGNSMALLGHSYEGTHIVENYLKGESVMSITLDILLKNGKRIETDLDRYHADKLEEILKLTENDVQSVIGNLEDTHYNMDFMNQVMCISTENHIELIAMSELKNLMAVVIIGFYEEFVSSEIHEDLWEKAYVNERINQYLLP